MNLIIKDTETGREYDFSDKCMTFAWFPLAEAIGVPNYQRNMYCLEFIMTEFQQGWTLGILENGESIEHYPLAPRFTIVPSGYIETEKVREVLKRSSVKFEHYNSDFLINEIASSLGLSLEGE